MLIRSKRDTPYQGKVRLGPGEVREVEDGEAQRLLATFPQWFEAVGAGANVAAPEDADAGPDSVETKATKRPPRSKPYKPRTK